MKIGVIELSRLKALGKYAAIFLSAVVITSILWNVNQILLFKGVSYAESYDYLVYIDGANVVVKNGTTGRVDLSSNELSEVLNALLKGDGLKIFIKPGRYNVSSNIMLHNLKGVKIIGNGPNSTKLNMNGYSLIIRGDSWNYSISNVVEGVEIYNGSIIIENSFKTVIRNCFFINSKVGIILMNTNGWTECTLIEECYFINAYYGIVFKTPINDGTKSYANTEIRRVYFELQQEGAVAIYIEKDADFNEGLIHDVRVWMGKPVERNQTGIFLEGSMLNTVLHNVVFESFAKTPIAIYGIIVGNYSDPPIIGQGVVFCGNLTGRIYNPYGKWLYSSSGAFKVVDVEVPLGVNNKFGPIVEVGALPHLSLAISALNAKVEVEGPLSEGEEIQVRLRFKFLDDSFSDQLILSFNSSGAVWVDQDGWLKIWPTRNVISALTVEARTNVQASNAKIKVSIYGQYG